MRKIIFNTNTDYLSFYNKYKDKILVHSISFTKNMKIRLFYDIM